MPATPRQVPKVVAGRRYKASRFNVMRTFGTKTVMGNSLSGAVATLDSQEIAIARSAMKGTVLDENSPPVVVDLIESGFLVDANANELSRVHSIHGALNDQRGLGLIIMPTEDCNFRCIYCYESFAKKAMKRPVREGLKALLDARVPRLESLDMGWFGGEPLFAFDVMRELGEHAIALCRKYGTQLTSHITTNAYMLDPEKSNFLVSMNTRSFQITVDGDRETHNRSRHLNGGGETFDMIWRNLLYLQSMGAEFNVTVRVNVDEKNHHGAMNLVQLFTDQFASDARFTIDFHNIWNRNGTASDDVVPFDGHQAVTDLKLLALSKNAERDCLGFKALGPGARYCYASKANSLVIGSDGSLYKCTVAFDDPRNLVGKVHPDGTLEIDDDLFALWTASDYRSDSSCQKCYYVPSCLGASCPLVRIESGKQPCPSDKVHVNDTMRVYDALSRQAEAHLEVV